METFFRFLYEFLTQFFNSFKYIFEGIANGFRTLFDFSAYSRIADNYKHDFNGPEWLFFAIAIIIVVAVIALIIFGIYLLIRKYVRFRKSLVDQESLLEEVSDLNHEVAKLMKEKEDILAMKVSNLGIRPDEAEGDTTQEEGDAVNPTSDIRFPKLYEVDQKFENYKVQVYNNTFELPDLVNAFRNFAASKLKLYYKEDMIRLFIASLASTKLVILQGISGTGKTSLAYARENS